MTKTNEIKNTSTDHRTHHNPQTRQEMPSTPAPVPKPIEVQVQEIAKRLEKAFMNKFGDTNPHSPNGSRRAL